MVVNLSFWSSDNMTSLQTVLGFPQQFAPATCPYSVSFGIASALTTNTSFAQNVRVCSPPAPATY